MDNTLIDLDKLPINIAKNLGFSNNEYLDSSACFSGTIWNDDKYFQLEKALVKYFRKNTFEEEIFPILNELYLRIKRSEHSTIDYQTCTDSCDNFTIDDRINHFKYLMRNGGIVPDDGYKPSSGKLEKTIEYMNDKNCIYLWQTRQVCDTVSVIAYGFSRKNKYKFKEFSYIGLFYVLSILGATNISIANIENTLNPLKLFLVTQDIELLSDIINNEDDFIIHRVGDNIALEFPIMKHAIYNKFKLDYYGIFYDNYERCSIIISQKFHKDFFSIFDDDGFVILAKMVDLAYKKKMMFLRINHDKRVEYGKLDIASASFKKLSHIIDYNELRSRMTW